ncbi:MAG: MarR family transcriptional regulator [Rhodobacter sp.]|nr:MarR family transcriptional regulator [Rhodobacter sp.]
MQQTSDLAFVVDRFMRRIHAGLHQQAVQVDTDRIGPFGGMILMAVAEMEPVSIHALVAHMARDKSQMTRSLRMLEERGLIARAGCPEDGRVSLVSLTSKGRDLVAAFQRILSEVLDGLMVPLGQAERAQLSALLRRL